MGGNQHWEAEKTPTPGPSFTPPTCLISGFNQFIKLLGKFYLTFKFFPAPKSQERRNFQALGGRDPPTALEIWAQHLHQRSSLLSAVRTESACVLSFSPETHWEEITPEFTLLLVSNRPAPGLSVI